MKNRSDIYNANNKLILQVQDFESDAYIIFTFEENKDSYFDEFQQFVKIVNEQVSRPLYEIQNRVSFYQAIMNRVANFSVPGAGKTSMVYGTYAYLSSESINKVDKIEKSGVHIVKSENIDAPIIEEFPLTLECKVIDIQEELGDYRVVAEIVNTLADESVLNEKGEIDVDKLELITFDSLTNSYRILGEKVGQAFKDGAKIK